MLSVFIFPCSDPFPSLHFEVKNTSKSVLSPLFENNFSLAQKVAFSLGLLSFKFFCLFDNFFAIIFRCIFKLQS